MTQNLTDPRQLAIQLTDQPFLVCAAAGTGKTSILIDRYLSILNKRQTKPAQIIAITFTEKAADEMRARLRSKLGQSDCQLTPELIAEVVEQLETAPIATVHSFCLRILRDNARFLDLDPNFIVFDEVEEQLFRQEMLTTFLYQALEDNEEVLSQLLQHFNLSRITQFISLITEKQNLRQAELRDFVAQSPETIHSNLVKNARQVNHELLKALFTSAPARQLEAQITAEAVKTTEDILFQALQNFITIKRAWEKHQLPDDVEESLRKILSGKVKGSQNNWYRKDVLENFRTLQSQLRELYQPIREQLVNISNLIGQKEEINLLQKIVHLSLRFADYYRVELRRQGKINFDGIESETVRLLEKHPLQMAAYLSHFQHLLVDEFQDINPIQYRIITLIQSCAPHIVTFFVGDEKQSIYRFRGAEVEIFNNLRERQQERLLFLDTNYRSAPQLMTFYNRLFSLYFGTEPSSMPFEVHYPTPIRAAKTQPSPLPPAEWLEIKFDHDVQKKEQATLPESMSIAVAIATRIKDLYQQPIIAEKDGFRAADYGDMVVLLRTRTHQEKFERVFRQFGIPYFVVKGIGFYHQREIIDLINFLRVLFNPTDAVALIGVLRSPLVGVSDRILNRFYNEHGICGNLYSYLFGNTQNANFLSPEEAEPLQRFREIYFQLQSAKTSEKASKLLQKIIDVTCYLPFLAAQPNGAQMVANVEKLIELCIDWEYKLAITPIDFIRRLQVYRLQEVREGDANLASESGHAVRIMTIHAAKGLDFPIVFVPFPIKDQSTKTGLLYTPQWGPSVVRNEEVKSEIHRLNQMIEAKRLAAEERRSFYVALTRAKDFLCICSLAPSEIKPENPWHYANQCLQISVSDGLCQYTSLDAAALTESWLKTTAQQSSSIGTSITILPDDILPLIEPIVPVPRRTHLTATEFAELVSAATLKQSLIQSDTETILSPTTLGSILHQLFAWWDFTNHQTIVRLLDEILKSYLLKPQEQTQIESLIQQWVQIVLQPENPLTALIHTATSRRPEVNLCGYYDSILLEGQTDLMLTQSDGTVSLVDFKTDQVFPHPEPTLVAKYQAQLRFYAFILEHCNHLPVSCLYLYFVRTGELLQLTWSPELLRLTASEIRHLISANSQEH